MIRNKRLLKVISIYLLVQFSFQIFFPTVSYALTSGPSQPEFSSFEPVSSSNMVDEFTGDFTYNLPLLEVPGPHGGSYPLSISYHSGVTPEEEASWVGFGWTLNAGAINRAVRGIPDDFKGETVTHHNKKPDNWTVTLGAGVFMELFSQDKGMATPSLSASYRYNNYRGFSVVKGLGLTLGGGFVNMGYSVSDGDGSFSLQISPMKLLQGRTDNVRDYTQGFLTSKISSTLSHLTSYSLGSKYGIFTYNQVNVMPTQVSKYSGATIDVSGATNFTPTQFPVGGGYNLMGSFSYQRNIDSQDIGAFGYLYSKDATVAHMMDYHIEKDNPFDKQDEFIGMPFNDADQFIVSGEGIGGGFRLYNRNIGHFGPTEVTSTSTMAQVGPEFEAGLNWGGGVDVGKGESTLKISDWRDRSNASLTSFKFADFSDASIDEPAIFRFNNDLGGMWGDKAVHDDSPTRFGVDANGNPNTSISDLANQGVRSGRSSYIGFHTNAQITGDVEKITTYSKRNWSTYVNRSQNAHQIGEIAVMNEDGMRHVYALPVYSKDERNLSFGLKGVKSQYIENNFISYQKREANMKIGQERLSPYAYSYLLTEIFTPDYIDKLRDGATQDDFGGYVRFAYNKVYGGAGTWYNWRMPYNGVSYQRNLLSDAGDDMGTLASGAKEIYYLKQIETKTHLAVFYVSDREDGLGALEGDAAMTKGAKSANKLKRLDKIELYSLESLGSFSRDAAGDIILPGSMPQPIKRVHLKYYEEFEDELMKGAPNSTSVTRGRLTLKKIYFEYNGVSQVKISPYEFHYKYPTSQSTPYPSEYVALNNFGGSLDENPQYDPFNIDAWGYYQPNGADRYAFMRTWLDQTKNGNVDFDPAAWHLKRIILPSGGEIHVQYEQDDYQYVQDQDAHVMVPLVTGEPLGIGQGQRYWIDLNKMGIAYGDAAAKTKLKELIEKRYIGTERKMYFKVLMALNKTGPSADLSTCNAEYLTGYASVTAVDYTSNGLYIDLQGRLPSGICQDFAYTHVIGKLNQSEDCNRSDGGKSDGLMAEITGTDNARAIAAVAAFFNATTDLVPGLSSALYCGDPNFSLSYLRVPTINPKKGGGVRVKRLMTYDNSVEGPMLYGNEYSYTTKDASGRAISSGVATNEPATIREENILVEYLPKSNQSWVSKVVAGKDKEVSEGPLGETVYPGSSVGYSRVVVTNIYSGKTSPGFAVTEYHTAQDNPIKVEKTDLNTRTNFDIQLGIWSNKFVNRQRATQGFSVVLNSMHGQLKRRATYPGNYTAAVDLSSPVTEQVLEYFSNDEGVPVMSSLYGSVSYKSIGREMDITLAQRSIEESSVNGNTEVDFTAGVFGIVIVPMASYMGSITKMDGLLNTHATTKVVRYPAVVKSVTTFQDGIYHTDEYVAFDESTGRPVAVKSEDEFKGAYLNQQIPAGWQYRNFAQRAMSEGKIIKSTGGLSMTFYSLSSDPNRFALKFTGGVGCQRLTEIAPGDLLKLSGDSFNPTPVMFFVETVDYGNDLLILTPDSRVAGGIFTGTPTINQITIVESGRNNRLSESAGEILFHDPDASSLTPSSFTILERYSTNSFTTALTNAYNAATLNIPFVVTGTYNDVNMAAYQHLAPSCKADWEHAKVTNAKFVRSSNSAGQVVLTMLEFYIDCDGTNTLIQNN